MSARKLLCSRYESYSLTSRKYCAGTRRDWTKSDHRPKRKRASALRQNQSPVLSQDWNLKMPLCWLPIVTKLWTLGKLHLSTKARRNCPPWEKPRAFTAGAVLKIGSEASCSQTWAICSVTLPIKVACRSPLSDSSSRIICTYVPGLTSSASCATSLSPSAW